MRFDDNDKIVFISDVHRGDGMKMSEALKTLSQSMDKSYELYHYLLILPIALTNLQ